MKPILRTALAICALIATATCGPATPEGTTTPADGMPRELRDLFARLPEPVVTSDDPARLVLRDGPPVPLAGREEMPFPPEASSGGPPPAQGPVEALRVLSYAPRGEDTLVGAIRITFSQPMVPMAQLSALREIAEPFVVTPKPAGQFRWLGTTTAAFEPTAGRMPLATAFTVEVPAGRQSALGGRLETTQRFTFETPRPAIVASLPGPGASSVGLEPIVALRFNQRVDPTVIANATSLIGPGNRRLVLLSDGALERAREENPTLATWEDDRQVVMAVSGPLSKGSTYQVVVRGGTRGAEGPLATTAELRRTFTTYQALTLVDAQCGYGGTCRPGSPLRLRFSNAIASTDEELAALVTLAPTVGRQTVQRAGSWLTLGGDYTPRTTYQLKASAGLRDQHGQTLGREITRAFTYGDHSPEVRFNGDRYPVFELASARALPIDMVNVPRVDSRMAAVRRQDLPRVLGVLQRTGMWYRGDVFAETGLTAIRGITRSTLARNHPGRVGLEFAGAVPSQQPGYALIEATVPSLRYQQVVVAQVTDLGVLAHVDPYASAVRVTSMASGDPVIGAEVRLVAVSNGTQVGLSRTDGTGLARFDVGSNDPVLVVASKGNDESFSLVDPGNSRPSVIGAIHTDRNPYRPGDTVHVRAIARQQLDTATHETRALPANTRADCELRDAHYQRILDWEDSFSAFGTLEKDLELPSGAATGNFSVLCTTSRLAGRLHGSFRVEEYRAPEIEVDVRVPERTLFHGDTPEVITEGRYLFGSPAAGLAARYTVGREATEYDPPGHPGYRFGDDTGFGWRSRMGVGLQRRHGRERVVVEWDHGTNDVFARGEGLLDSEGRLVIAEALDPGDIAGPVRFTFESEVVDSSRQTVAGRASLISHPADAYVGLRLSRPFVREGEPVFIDAKLVSVTGDAILGRSVAVRVLERKHHLVASTEGGRTSFEWQHVDREVGKCDLQSAAEAVRCRVVLPQSGSYVVEATATDRRGRATMSAQRVYAFGRGFIPYGDDNTESVELIPDRESYSVGDVARILVRAPFAGGRGLLSLERAGAIDTRTVDFDGSIQVVEVPITASHLPNLHVRLSLARGRASRAELATLLADAGPDARQALADDVGRPAHAVGIVDLKVNRDARRLAVEVRPDHDVRSPGDHLGITVAVRGPRGEPARADLAIAVVDEAVLSLLAYETPDPLSALHPDVQSALRAAAVQARLVRRRPMDNVAATTSASMDGELVLESALGGAGSEGGPGRPRRRGPSGPPDAAPAPQVTSELRDGDEEASNDAAGPLPGRARNLFATTAFYRAGVRTDGDGNARVEFDLPDNLTTFRIMAIAVDRGDMGGSGDAKIEVRKAVLLRPALPRFASFGDRFDAAVIVHNETGKEADVVVGMRAAGIEARRGNVQRLRLAHGASREVIFPVTVTAGGGSAQIQFAASAQPRDGTDGGADAVEVSLPLAEPATSEAFATYGSLAAGVEGHAGDVVRLPVRVPEGVVDRWGQLEIKLSSTALTGLDDAAEYLFDYPYLCAEQLASRLVAAAALSVVLRDRSPAGKARADTVGAATLAALGRLQRPDGGFALWPTSRDRWLYTSAWVTFALVEAKDAGMAIDANMMQRATTFLGRRLRYPNRSLGEHTAYSVQALAVYALSRAGQTPNDVDLGRIYEHRGDLPLFGKSWLIAALHRTHPGDGRVETLWREVENAAVETPSAAHFGEQRVESARLLWHSARRSDAIILGMMLEVKDDHPLIEKTVRGLIAAQRQGRWVNTQENAWALSSLFHYYREREREVPDMVVRSWLGSAFVGNTELRGRSGTIMEGTVPMAAMREIADTGGNGIDLVVAPDGRGRLYYRVGLRYASTDMSVPPDEQGFSVTRGYESIERDNDVARSDDGGWRIRAGATVRVRLTVVVPDDRYDVALDDPLPAGLEAVNMALSTTSSQRLGSEQTERIYDGASCWALFAFEHRELRDDRVVAFARRAPAGVYELSYLARATTSGRFIAAPTKAEEMYAPEVFGRTASDVVTVYRE